MNDEMLAKIDAGNGFIAALDQSGGSTPGALANYGIPEDSYDGEEEMFDLVHAMRTRIMTSPSFTGEQIVGAILFVGTMDREVEGMPSAKYLWEEKNVVPFVKVDEGKEDLADGVQMMSPMPNLDDTLARARENGVFGTKMRSVITEANADGINAITDQQFEVGRRILDAGFMPILEPEVDIHAEDKAECEQLLRARILENLDQLDDGQQVVLKLTLPSEDGFYDEVVAHDGVLKVVALSGGYSRAEATDLLAANPGVIASFSRALIGELSAKQSDDEFNQTLATAIESIHAASVT